MNRDVNPFKLVLFDDFVCTRQKDLKLNVRRLPASVASIWKLYELFYCIGIMKYL